MATTMRLVAVVVAIRHSERHRGSGSRSCTWMFAAAANIGFLFTTTTVKTLAYYEAKMTGMNCAISPVARDPKRQQQDDAEN